MRIVVPDQRNEPGIAGVTLKNGAVTRAGMLPSVTIGSEKTIADFVGLGERRDLAVRRRTDHPQRRPLRPAPAVLRR